MPLSPPGKLQLPSSADLGLVASFVQHAPALMHRCFSRLQWHSWPYLILFGTHVPDVLGTIWGVQQTESCPCGFRQSRFLVDSL